MLLASLSTWNVLYHLLFTCVLLKSYLRKLVDRKLRDFKFKLGEKRLKVKSNQKCNLGRWDVLYHRPLKMKSKNQKGCCTDGHVRCPPRVRFWYPETSSFRCSSPARTVAFRHHTNSAHSPWSFHMELSYLHHPIRTAEGCREWAWAGRRTFCIYLRSF